MATELRTLAAKPLRMARMEDLLRAKLLEEQAHGEVSNKAISHAIVLIISGITLLYPCPWKDVRDALHATSDSVHVGIQLDGEACNERRLQGASLS